MLSQENIGIIKSTAPVLEAHGTEITQQFYKNLFTSHPELLNIFNDANQRNGKQQAALANAVYAAAVHIDNLETIIPVVKQISGKHRSLGVKPEHYPIVGENLLLAMGQVLGDAATPEIIDAWGKAYGIIADAFISVEKGMYEEASEQPGGWADFKPFKVQKRVKESSVITSFYLVPVDGSQLPKYQPGQYVSVKVDIPDAEYTNIRQYSLSDSNGKGYYRISVKREDAIGDKDKGTVSNYLHGNIEPGDTLLLSAPAGDFTLDTKSDKPVVLLSGGVGITPMMSMLHSVVENHPERHVTFVHAAISGGHHALKNEVEELVGKSENANAFYVYESPTDEDVMTKDFHLQGYVNLQWLQETVPHENAEFYVCGPLPFMKAIFGALTSWGIPPEQMHYEVFGPNESLLD